MDLEQKILHDKISKRYLNITNTVTLSRKKEHASAIIQTTS